MRLAHAEAVEFARALSQVPACLVFHGIEGITVDNRRYKPLIGKCLINAVVSMGRRNTSAKSKCVSFKG
jgi:hypothetical protein